MTTDNHPTTPSICTKAPTPPNPNSHKSIKKALLRFLITQFPHTFFEKERYPLKVGITKDIAQWFEAHLTDHPVPDKKLLISVLGRYTSSPKYLLSLQADDAVRLDLAGQPAGKVTIKELEYAKHKLETLHQILSARHLKKKLAAQAEAAKRAELLRQKAEKMAKKATQALSEKKKTSCPPKPITRTETSAQPSSTKSQPIIRFIRRRTTLPEDQK